MGGPIVRTGTTPAFWENYDRVFSGKGKKSSAKTPAGKKPAKPAKPVKSAKKAGKKTVKKKKK